jgi:DnaJ family protein C protein 19
MIKLLMIAVLISVACRWAFGRWPWDYLDAKPTSGQAVLKARKVLSVHHEASREEILAAHRRTIAVVHPDRGGTSAQVHEADAARDLLLNDLPDPN